MSFSLVVAMARDGVIGDHNRLPWHLPEDLRHFKMLTMGHPILMGRKTFAAIGRPLPGRENIVLTRDMEFGADGVTVIHNPQELIHRSGEEIFVIGGAEVYKIFWPQVGKIYLTLVQGDFSGDAFFPVTDWQSEFVVSERSGVMVSAKNNLSYEFITALRRAT